MKKATVRDLRNEFRRISTWSEAGETVQVLKRGKPFARVVPETRPKTTYNGLLAATGTFAIS